MVCSLTIMYRCTAQVMFLPCYEIYNFYMKKLSMYQESRKKQTN